jgi:hypothetical protein
MFLVFEKYELSLKTELIVARSFELSQHSNPSRHYSITEIFFSPKLLAEFVDERRE